MSVLSPPLISNSASVGLEPKETSVVNNSTSPRRLFANVATRPRRSTRDPDEIVESRSGGIFGNISRPLPEPEEIRDTQPVRGIAASELRVAAEIRAETAAAEIRAEITKAKNCADKSVALEIRAEKTKAEIRAAPSTTVMKGTMVSLPSTTVAPASTVGSLSSTSVTPASLELPSVSATISSSWTPMLSTRHNDALLSFSGEVQQSI